MKELNFDLVLIQKSKVQTQLPSKFKKRYGISMGIFIHIHAPIALQQVAYDMSNWPENREHQIHYSSTSKESSSDAFVKYTDAACTSCLLGIGLNFKYYFSMLYVPAPHGKTK